MKNFSTNRKTTPRVRDGEVQTKNRQTVTRLNGLSIGLDKKGGRHVLTKEDVWKFIRLIPGWKRVSTDLDLIYLAGETNQYVDGWYESRGWPIIALNSWAEDLTSTVFNREYVEQHRSLLARLGVEIDEREDWHTILRFDEDSARAFQLLHIFLHELGHHHHRIVHGRGVDSGSEKYAETYALKMERRIWKQYCEAFHFRPSGAQENRAESRKSARER